MTMRAWLLIPLLVRAGVLAPDVAPPAPPADQLRIQVRGYTIGAKGGEQENVGFGGMRGPMVLGEPARSAFSIMPQNCLFAVRAANARRTLDDGAVGGWTAEVTPIRVAERTVTFRIAWTRIGEDGKTPADRGDEEVTLGPGESLPLDTIQFSARARQLIPSTCDARATSLRVGVEYDVRPADDRRLLESDVWLIEHLPGGTERSQHTQVRGQFNVPSSFFFDDVNTAAGAFDIAGEFTARQMDGYVEVAIEVRRRIKDQLSRGAGGLSRVLRLKADDVASIELPPIVESPQGQTAPRIFSLRIRTKQIR